MASAISIGELLAPLAAAPAESALFLDVDGTLAPIVSHPSRSALLPGARPTLCALRDRLALVGFISGRELSDAERLVGVPGCAYAGNHGMELRRPGEEAEIAPSVQPHLETIARFATDWEEDLLAAHGIWIEDKRVSLAFHYRTSSRPTEAAAFLAERVAPAAHEAGLRSRSGRRILEVLPAVSVSKGTAIRELVSGRGITRAAYAGDDRTDIDGWRALASLQRSGALTHIARIAVAGIEVPEEVRADADVEVEGPYGLLAALRSFATRIEGAPASR